MLGLTRQQMNDFIAKQFFEDPRTFYKIQLAFFILKIFKFILRYFFVRSSTSIFSFKKFEEPWSFMDKCQSSFFLIFRYFQIMYSPLFILIALKFMHCSQMDHPPLQSLFPAVRPCIRLSFYPYVTHHISGTVKHVIIIFGTSV